MDKKQLTERDIQTKFVYPALQDAGWDTKNDMLEEYFFTDGKITVRGDITSQGSRKRVDCLLLHEDIPIALIETKSNKHPVGGGIQQAINYAETLDVPFAYSSNGDGFLEHNRSSIGDKETLLKLDEFPSPQELWTRYKQWKEIDENQEPVVTQKYYTDYKTGKSPRYYQRIAINRTVEAIVKGQKRLLLVMATGTGKTYVAFQIIWRLWKSQVKKRILFLADRNILVDQTRNNDFRPFSDVMTKISSRNVDTAYEVYLALYQGISGNEEKRNIYKQFSPDFFDLIVVDECHRGSAAEDSAWREILEYYSSATQIGLTATPKETKKVSNIDYFGEPVYMYSLKQGIEDGFLAPYRVIRVTIDKDVEGWRPSEDKNVDDHGNLIPDQVYNVSDFDRKIVIDERTMLVARRVTEYLQGKRAYDKTIIFCIDVEHADRMRQAMVKLNPKKVHKNSKYVVRITGDDEYGKRELDRFINPEETYPVVATTSELMSTGVDAQTCKLIVLDSNIHSMTKFKQIIGRGTRLNKEYGKYFFTILDFRQVTNLFSDPDFDGDPVQIMEIKGDDVLELPEDQEDQEQPPHENQEETEAPDPTTDFIYTPPSGHSEVRESTSKYHVSGIEVRILNERVQYYGDGGQLITESLKDYTRKNIQKQYSSLDEFLNVWDEAQQRQTIIREMEQRGVFFDALQKEVGKDFSVFDLICHVAFHQPPLTRRERANNVKKRNYFTKYGDQAKEVLEALLDKYADSKIEDISNVKILRMPPFNKIGSPVQILKLFGGKAKYMQAVQQIYSDLYKDAP